MQTILNYIDINILAAIAVVLGLTAFLTLLQGKISIYEELKLALMVAGAIFRDEKIEKIADISHKVISEIEKLDKSNYEKKDIAMKEVSQAITAELGIKIDEKLLDIIVEIAVSHLPKTGVK